MNVLQQLKFVLGIGLCLWCGVAANAQENTTFSPKPLLLFSMQEGSNIASMAAPNNPLSSLQQPAQPFRISKVLPVSKANTANAEYPLLHPALAANKTTMSRNNTPPNTIPTDFYTTTHNAFFCRTERKIARRFFIPVDFTLEQQQ